MAFGVGLHDIGGGAGGMLRACWLEWRFVRLDERHAAERKNAGGRQKRGYSPKKTRSIICTYHSE